MKILREGPTKITRSTIDVAWRRRAAGFRIVIGDFECRGLALITNATSMSWVYSYKPRGVDPSTGRRFPTKSLTIGNPETHSPDLARTAANEFKGRAKAGFDPAADRKAGIQEAADLRGSTVDRMVEEYARVLPSRRRLRGPGVISKSFANEEISHVRAAVAAQAWSQANQGGERHGHSSAFARRSRASQRRSSPFRGYPALLRLVS